MVKLPFMLSTIPVDKSRILNQGFKLNNELVIPMKVLDIEEQKVNDKLYHYYVNVEECLDQKEWTKFCAIYFMGYSAYEARLI